MTVTGDVVGDNGGGREATEGGRGSEEMVVWREIGGEGETGVGERGGGRDGGAGFEERGKGAEGVLEDRAGGGFEAGGRGGGRAGG